MGSPSLGDFPSFPECDQEKLAPFGIQPCFEQEGQRRGLQRSIPGQFGFGFCQSDLQEPQGFLFRPLCSCFLPPSTRSSTKQRILLDHHSFPCCLHPQHRCSQPSNPPILLPQLEGYLPLFPLFLGCPRAERGLQWIFLVQGMPGTGTERILSSLLLSCVLSIPGKAAATRRKSCKEPHREQMKTTAAPG